MPSNTDGAGSCYRAATNLMEHTCAWVQGLGVADCAPLLGFQEEGEEERHCSLILPMGKAGGEGEAAAPRPLRTPHSKSEAAHLGLKPQPLLLCGLGLALSRSCAPSAKASWMRRKLMGSQYSRLAGELCGGVLPTGKGNSGGVRSVAKRGDFLQYT
jgi:hypothetical protein